MVEGTLLVTEATFVRASERDDRAGLLGYVSVTLNDTLRLDGITLRRSSDGHPYLAYPCRTDAAGRRHALSRPLDNEARQLIEDQVFEHLGIGETPPRIANDIDTRME